MRLDHPPFLILRHGETVWNREGRFQGHLDSPLTPKGIGQAQAQWRILCGLDLTGFQALCSPIGRAKNTAEIALRGLIAPVRMEHALKEIGIGDWAGQSREVLMQHHGASDGFALYDAAPNGEGFQALYYRCNAFLNGIKRPSVLVTHGITSRMLRLILTGQPIENIPQMKGGQGVVYQVMNNKQSLLSERA